jgi:hypothetical protein
MRRRRLLLGAVVLALLGVAGALLPLMLPRRGAGITRANYEQIREGMTLDEVEAILGDPAGDYTGGQFYALPVPAVKFLPPRHIPVIWRDWISKEGCISIGFSESGQVGRKRLLPVEREHATFLDRLRHLLPW